MEKMKKLSKKQQQSQFENDELNAIFLQFPWFLLKSDYYKNMSLEAKLAYALFKDKNKEAIKKRWVDENGVIYFNYTTKKLQAMLDVGKNKAINIKKELINYGLLVVKKQGFNPKLGRNEPDRLYIQKPILTVDDVYEKSQKESSALQPSGGLQNKPRQQKASALQPSGGLQNKPRQKESSALQPSGGLQNKRDLEEDTNYIETNKKLVDTPQKESYSQETTPSFDIFTKESNLWLQKIADTDSNLTIQDLKNTIFTAKAKALKDTGFTITTVFDIKDFSNFVTKTIKGLVKAIKSTGGVKNVKGYLYSSIYKGFTKYAKLYNYATENGIVELTDVNSTTEKSLDEVYRALTGSELQDLGFSNQ